MVWLKLKSVAGSGYFDYTAVDAMKIVKMLKIDQTNVEP